jgi:DNA-binding LytR/AlgR family response regulator
MKCLIVDDDKLSRASLEFICSRIDGLQVTSVESAGEAGRMLNSGRYDFVFLDIEMPEVSGLDFIRLNKQIPPIIITSSNKDYAFDAFQLDAVDYLSKPLTITRVMKAISKVNALAGMSSSNTVQPVGERVVFIRVDGRNVKLELDDIHLVESMRDYVMFRTATTRYVVHSTLKNIEERLGHDGRFLKIHRSFIINTDHITDFDDRNVVVGPYTVPVSRSNRSALLKQLKSL